MADKNTLHLHRKSPDSTRTILGSWVSRIMSPDKPEQAMVHPCMIDGEHTLIHERGLQEKDQLAYQHILEFAEKNGFKVREDQRADFIEGVKRVKNKKRANVMTVMALTATMLSQGAMAKPSFGDSTDTVHVEHKHSAHDFEFEIDGNANQEQMVKAMFDWINSHSSFNHDVSVIPDIRQVSSTEIAEIAFGGKLPQAVDPEKLKIYGLYNFNEGAVYILDSLDLNTEKGKGILLHELVHFLQYQYDKDEDVACKNELESLAYVLEARFLQSYDEKHAINMSHVERVSQCA